MKEKTFLNQWENKPWPADVGMCGVAIDATSTYKKGAWYGPQAIMDASSSPNPALPAIRKVI